MRKWETDTEPVRFESSRVHKSVKNSHYGSFLRFCEPEYIVSALFFLGAEQYEAGSKVLSK